MRFALTRVDGGVEIMTVNGVTPEQCIAKWPAHRQAEISAIHPLDENTHPTERTFRNAWIADKGSISVHIDKAKEIWRDKMRAARVPLLAALDVEYQRADEVGDAVAKADVVRRKQELRDVTNHPALVAARSVEDIKAVWPSYLGEQ